MHAHAQLVEKTYKSCGFKPYLRQLIFKADFKLYCVVLSFCVCCTLYIVLCLCVPCMSIHTMYKSKAGSFTMKISKIRTLLPSLPLPTEAVLIDLDRAQPIAHLAASLRYTEEGVMYTAPQEWTCDKVDWGQLGYMVAHCMQEADDYHTMTVPAPHSAYMIIIWYVSLSSPPPVP